jgi:hypothetical protein
VPAGLVDRWSSRDREIRAAIEGRLNDKEARLVQEAAQPGPDAALAAERLAALRASRELSAGENRLVTVATRSRKDPRVTHADLDEHWRGAARAYNLDAGALDRLRVEREPPTAAREAELLFRLTEFDATFPAHTSRAVAMEASVGVPIADGLAVLDQVTRSGGVLQLADGRQTTQIQRFAERRTVWLAHQLAGQRVPAIRDDLVVREAKRLDDALRSQGSALSPEQLDAVRRSCSERQLVVVEGQAGTGKSTVLQAIARSHQAQGQQILVTSTGALAAERLARELAEAGVQAEAYSTARLHAGVMDGRVTLGPQTTVIHDEAALASTREQHRLLSAVDDAGARLIEVGDPGQSRPVGAGGLWPELERATRSAQGHVELTRNVRAHDPADRRDQRLFRDGQAEQALSGYQARGRLMSAPEQRAAEDLALEAAHADGQAGKRTLVVAQTSNEHLDQLNARAQAIRLEYDELGGSSVAVRGRPYALHTDDQIQVRRNLNRPGIQLRNGTTGHVSHIDTDANSLEVELANGRTVSLTSEQLAQADVRLAYVQHPLPAQGQTTDTAHVIVAEHATQEGSYVALTRARERTHIYASEQQLDGDDTPDHPAALAAHMSRTEPEIPSINIPLAHEAAITAAHRATDAPPASPLRAVDQNGPEQLQAHPASILPEHLTKALGQPPDPSDPERQAWNRAANAIRSYRTRYRIEDDETSALGPEPAAGEFQQRHDRKQAVEQLGDALQHVDRAGKQLDPVSQRIPDIRRRLAPDEPTREQDVWREP